jgi:phosphoribosyl-ATP pyrophosphohydrolase
MILPSIDLERGRAVQLVGGERLAIDAGDPMPILERFSVCPEVAVVDLDGARGEGSHEDLVRAMCRRASVRVGGGIRTVEAARAWLDAGAVRIVVGTAAEPSFLRQLPKERVIVALDEKGGEVVTHGWRRGTGSQLLERVRALRDLCSGFLVTFVDREGRMQGTDLERAQRVVEAAGNARVTIAGGVTTAEDIAALDRLGADAQVGMALYTGRLSLADAIGAPLRSDRSDGLWPTVVVDEHGIALGLCWSSQESLRLAVEERRGIYHSRTRGIWRKGESSGAVQQLLAIDLDCDRDALRFTMRQSNPGFCHRGTRTCFGEDRGLSALQRRLQSLRREAKPESNTARLFADPSLLAAKLREEARELGEPNADVVHEAADLCYFALVRLVGAGFALDDLARELDRRALRVSRRACAAKEER